MRNGITYSIYLKDIDTWKHGFSSLTQIDCYISEHNLLKKEFKINEVDFFRNEIKELTEYYKQNFL